MHGLQIWKRGIKSLKDEENMKKRKILASGTAQDALNVKTCTPTKRESDALSVNTGTCTKRVERAKREYVGPSPLQQL